MKKVTKVTFWKFFNADDMECLNEYLLPNFTGHFYSTKKEALREKHLWDGCSLHKCTLIVNMGKTP